MKKDISPLYVFGCNFSIRKDVLLDAGGFHPDGMPSKLITFRGDGETHVSKHIMDSGYRAVYNPKASVYHFVPKGRMTDEYFCRRAYMQGISDSYSILRERYRVKERPPKSNSIRNILKQFKAYCKVAFNSSLEKRINRSYREGFEFHQRAADCNSELMNWVLKKDYMG
jgi:hypothetical protein